MADKTLHSETTKPDSKDNLSVCILASGSKGNATFVASSSTSILVDAGLTGIEIERRLKSRGLCPEDLDAILVTHEHTDHIQGAGVLSRRYNLPVYISSRTRKEAEAHLGKVYKYKEFKCGTTFNIDNLVVHPFSVPHDAGDPGRRGGSHPGHACSRAG